MESEEIKSAFYEIEKEMRGPASRLAPKKKRFLNYTIDLICVFILFIVFQFMLLIISGFIRIDISENISTGLYLNIALIISQTFYYLFFEFLFGKTVGKLLTGTHVVKVNGDKLDFKTSFIRSISRLIPLDALSFLDKSMGWHDALSKTYVVNDE